MAHVSRLGMSIESAAEETFTKPTYKGNHCLVQGLAIRLRQRRGHGLL
jgi:hypothetical protein